MAQAVHDDNYVASLLAIDPSGNPIPIRGDSATGAIYVTLAGSTGTNYLGTWNASTNTPTIVSGVGGVAGEYYIVSVAGTTSIDGINDWGVGDWIVWNGSEWQRIDNSSAKQSYFITQALVVGANVITHNLNLTPSTNCVVDVRNTSTGENVSIPITAYTANSVTLTAVSAMTSVDISVQA